MRRLPRSLQVAAAVLAGGMLLSWGVSFALWEQPLDQGAGGARIIEIPPGSTLRKTARLLEEEGFISSAPAMELLGRLSGASSHIQPGEYQISSAMSPRRILDTLVAGQVVLRTVTIPEGFTVKDAVARLADAGFGTVEAYEELLHDPEFQREAGIVTEGVKVPFEGYLFPDTYRFAKDTPAETVLRTMLQRLDAVFTPERLARMEELGWNRHQTLTMASIIEKETARADERARISAVFHNRLARGMRLQTDPTVIYAIPHFDGDIRFRDLRRDDPYNTYRHNGLPPGPIANPGEAAIHAALFPADDPALFFVSRGDGTHIFSETITAHNQAVRLHQK